MSARTRRLDVVLFAAVCVTPIVVLIASLALGMGQNRASTTSREPQTVRVGEREIDYRQAATLTFSLTAAPAIRGLAGGTVTGIDVAAGSKAENGSTLIHIDGRPVRAFVAHGPLYRPIEGDTTGTDVDELRTFLAAAGSPVGGGPASLGAAISAYQKSVGLEATGIFLPGYVAFVEEGATAISSVDVRIGDVVDGGFTIARGTPTPSGMTISSADGTPLRDLGDDAVAMSFGQQSARLKAPTPNHAEAVELYPRLVAAAASGAITSAGGSPDDVTASFQGAFVSLAAAERHGSVPAGSVFVGASGRECVIERRPPRSDKTGGLEVVSLDSSTAAAGEPGLALVSPSLIGRSVVRDPSTVASTVLKRCK